MKPTLTPLKRGLALAGLVWAMCPGPSRAQEDAAAPETAVAESSAAGGAAAAREELRAKRMIENALELMQTGQEERGIGMMEAVSKMFPNHQARFRAALELGRYHLDKKNFEKAIRHLNEARNSEDPVEQAEAWYRIGAANFDQGKFNESFVALRRVTNEFPSSSFANDAYYLIGQGHFKQGRWAKAVEAFRMVGTATPATEDSAEVLAEAGQRLFIKVEDKDLRILSMLGENTSVKIQAESGDSEVVPLEKLGRTEQDWIASVVTLPEPTQPNDGKLTVQGGEVITATYVDRNNASGQVDVKLNAKVRMVSTGAITFTDGAYNRTVRGVFAGQPAFLRLTDLDLDKGPGPDTAEVRVVVRFKVEPPKDPVTGETVLPATAEPAEEIWEERGSLVVKLTETAPHSGEFRGSFFPVLESNGGAGAAEVIVRPDDVLAATHLDETHLGGRDPVERSVSVRVVVGGNTDPQSIVSSANDANTQARKLLIEAQLLHKWGTIFKEVGLEDTAAAKAEEGLDRADEIMRLTARNSLDRLILEESFAVKWDLLLIQNRLNEAIATCKALVQLFPDTTLADRAFMKIAQARIETKKPSEILEGIRVYRQVIALPQSEYKAEAQFRIGEATEELVKLSLKPGGTPNFAPAMLEFKTCAETYPDSSFAGESFKRIIKFYIDNKDYTRSVEILDRVFQDYPDAPWLDEMLLRWGVVAFRMQNRDLAVQKFTQVLQEYPDGQAAQQAAQFLQRLQ